jgi:hypothetical protein
MDMREETDNAALPVSSGPVGIGQPGLLQRFATVPGDAVGLAAYGLHCRAADDFRRDFLAHHGRLPSDSEEKVFLIGEQSETRIAAYRQTARAMIETQLRADKPSSPSGSPPLRKPRWPWFGMWVEAPMAPAGSPETINWRGLFGRLAILLLAVVATALLLRILVAKS